MAHTEVEVCLIIVKRFATTMSTLLLTCALVLGLVPVSLAAPGGASIDAATKKLQTMESQMATAQKEYRTSATKLARARANAANSRKELKKLNARIETNRQSLNIQANYLYRAGNLSFLEAVFSSQSFSEVFSKINLLSQVSDSNAKVLNDLRKDLQHRATVQADLDQQLKNQEAETAALKRQSQQATRNLIAQQDYINSLSAQQQEALDAARRAANNRPSSSSKPESNHNPPSSGGGDYNGTGQIFTGLATWYGTGRGTASGEPFNPNAMTAAHKTLPFGTLVRVTYKGRSVVVRINDRGPYGAGRVIDLTRAAAEVIGMKNAGVGQVTCEIVN
ncbi:MAG: septal ring lytic transglycosylase RlpA family protein [Actinomycetia bacterium]|nr:septal ring lytic transglycosylase RlpA family protein [Actinomycetes bacterium]